MLRKSTKEAIKQWAWLAAKLLVTILIVPIAITIWATAELLRWRDRRKKGEKGRIFIGKT